MRYLCTNCSYIYDEDLWDLEENIVAWTKFENLWDAYCCPVCSALPDIFHEIKQEINYLWDIPMDVIEAEHFINIEKILWDDNNAQDIIKVNVWKWDYHPSWLEHRITSMWLYDEYWDLVYEIFLWNEQTPELEFDISSLDDYEIRVRCSLHGVWSRKIER